MLNTAEVTLLFFVTFVYHGATCIDIYITRAVMDLPAEHFYFHRNSPNRGGGELQQCSSSC